LSKIAFKVVTGSEELALEHSILVSSPYTIGLNDLFVENEKSLIYKRKIKGSIIEPYLTLCHLETTLV
jgi:hypothetical protein